MKIFVISDTHFGHRSLADKYQTRPKDFENRIIHNWQKMVSDEDLIIHLGDVIIGKESDWKSVISELPGRKILVTGNHDKKTLSWYLTNIFEFCCNEFYWYMYGMRILFSHEPRFEGRFDMNIHGHLHHPNHHPEYKCDERHCLISLENTSYQPQMLKSIVVKWQQSNKAGN